MMKKSKGFFQECGVGEFSAREFNDMSVDYLRGTITKSSKTKKQKLLDEANWYNSLPAELLPLAPRVFNVTDDGTAVRVEMELYGYPNLAQVFVRTSTDLDDWCIIIDKLLKTHGLMEKYTVPMQTDELVEIYQNKTRARLAEIIEQNPEIAEMMGFDTLIINGKEYKNLSSMQDLMFDKIHKLTNYERCTVVHGDYCFSNILFDARNNVFKLIDPRGRFKTQSIYGDPRYDMAKLRHSIVGMYDFIVAGLYSVIKTGKNEYLFNINTLIPSDNFEKFFDELMTQHGYDKDDIKLIEALLFLTMIPLHGDDVNRQKAFYLTAIKKLNEVIYG